eukprot:764442-Hanusia_phi.AAC.3
MAQGKEVPKRPGGMAGLVSALHAPPSLAASHFAVKPLLTLGRVGDRVILVNLYCITQPNESRTQNKKQIAKANPPQNKAEGKQRQLTLLR